MSSSEQTIAFIGLGNMGAPMVANLCAKGFGVRAFDVSAQALQNAVAVGCEAAVSATDAVAGADVVLTMLPNGEIVESLLIDEQRLLEVIPSGALLIDCSTVSATTSLRVHQHADSLGVQCL
ncbi:MAG TPA: 3-hydroxyisobutyrate dehydrogenase, partial [Gammaproteobacteria bacterium]|nr:3-hydroxyisobutyrate dehydrogenase [Gammaproteobacteria bacterium]